MKMKTLGPEQTENEATFIAQVIGIQRGDCNLDIRLRLSSKLERLDA